MRPTPVLIGAVVASLLSACSGSDAGSASEPTGQPSGSASASASHSMAEHSPSASDVAGAMDDLTEPAGGSGSTTPADTALRLEALIGQHSVLASDMMRARIRQDSDLAQVANKALATNTEAMAEVLAPGLGKAGREQFEEMWAEHVEELFEYARGVATKDEEVTEHALEEIEEYEEELIVFFDEQSDGRLGPLGAKEGIRTHSRHLVEAADAYAAKDYVRAARLYRESYNHTFDLGATLARALLAPDVARALDKPTVRLRSALTKQLGEHVALVVGTMRASIGDKADYAAMGKALNGNTVDLTGSMDTLFGAKAARQFQSGWADHVDQLMLYTAAVIGGDAAGKQQAEQQLEQFQTSFAGFLNAATKDRLGLEALNEVLVSHDAMLMKEIDVYAAKDYQQATDLSYRIYGEMFTMSGQLAKAFGSTVAAKLPTGGSETGGGGAA